MKEPTMTRIKTMLACGLIVSILLLGSPTVRGQGIIPFTGASQPIGSASDTWATGYSVGVDMPVSQRHGLDWTATLSIERMSPNAAEMLRTGGRTLKVESSRGWSAIFEASLSGGHVISASRDGLFSLRAFGGVGLFYVRDADVLVSGFYPTPTTALNRQIFIPGQVLVVPGLTIGVSGEILGLIEPTIRLQHVLVGDANRTFLLIGVGFNSD